MPSQLTRQPSQRGARPGLTSGGDPFLGIRDHDDEPQKPHSDPLRLIIWGLPWNSKPPRLTEKALVKIRVGMEEVERPRRVIQAGERWHPAQHLWELRSGQASVQGVEARIEGQELPNIKQTKLANSEKSSKSLNYMTQQPCNM